MPPEFLSFNVGRQAEEHIFYTYSTNGGAGLALSRWLSPPPSTWPQGCALHAQEAKLRCWRDIEGGSLAKGRLDAGAHAPPQLATVSVSGFC